MGDSVVPRVRRHPDSIREILNSLHSSTPEFSHVPEPLAADVSLSEDEHSQSDDDGEYTTTTRHQLRISSHNYREFKPHQPRIRNLERLSEDDPRTDYVQFDPASTSRSIPDPVFGSEDYINSLSPTYDHSSSPRSCPPILNTLIASSDGVKQRRADSPQRASSLALTKTHAELSRSHDKIPLTSSNSSITKQEADVLNSGTFTSHCSFRPAGSPTNAETITPIPRNSTLPQKERLKNVHRVIAVVEKVFVPTPTIPSFPSSDDAEGLSGQESDRRIESPVHHGTTQNPEHYHSIIEPNDCPEAGGQNNAHGVVQFSGAATGKGGPMRHKHSGSGGRDRSTPYERPNDDRIAASSSKSAGIGHFCCVYAGRNNNSDCKKCHKYVSELRVHHGGNGHQFFYCAVCFSRFATKGQRNDHDTGHCEDALCVTMGCPNYESDLGPSCNHPGRTNHQVFVWIKLYQLARPNDQIPSDIRILAEAVMPTAGAPTVTSPTAHTYTPMSQVEPSSSQRATLEQHSSNPAALSPAAPCSDTQYTQALRTLASLLCNQLELPDSNGHEVLQDMYTSYLTDDAADFSSQCGSKNCTAVVTGLRKLCRQMWRAIGDPEGTNATQVSQIRDWAHGILSESDTASRPKGKAPVRTIQSSEPEVQSPSEAKNLRRQQSRSHNIANMGTHFFEHGHYVNTNAPNEQQIFVSGIDPYDPATQDMITLFPELQQDHQPQPPSNEPIMTWNENNNAESFSQENALTKSNTRDSGYGTGRSC